MHKLHAATKQFTRIPGKGLVSITGVLIFLATCGQFSVIASSCPCDGGRLVSWWSGDGDATDKIGGHNGTLGGNTTFVTGVAGQAFRFDGDGDGIAIGNPAELQLQDFSIAAWVRRASPSQVSNASSFGEILGYGFGGYVLGFLPDGRLFLSKHGIDFVGSNGAITDTEWHQVAVTKTGASVEFYIDGQLDSSVSYSTSFDFYTDIDIGAVLPDFEASFFGNIDELQVYDFALTGSDISFLHQNPGARVPDKPSCISELQNTQDQIQRLTDAFRTKFNSPGFTVIGATAPAQVESLVSAILKLNYGQQQAIFFNLGGTNAPH